MLNNITYIVQIIGVAIVAFIIYSVLKKYVFSKLKVNKWVIICIMVAIFVAPLILSQANVFQMNSIAYLIQSGVLVVVFLWFMDTMGWAPKPKPARANLKTNKAKYATTQIIKAKAKPNRLKNTDMEVIQISDIKKKKKK